MCQLLQTLEMSSWQICATAEKWKGQTLSNHIKHTSGTTVCHYGHGHISKWAQPLSPSAQGSQVTLPHRAYSSHMLEEKVGRDKCQRHLSNAQTCVYSCCRHLTAAVLCLSPALQRGPQKPALCLVWWRQHCSHNHSQNSYPTIKLYSFHLVLRETRLMQSC